MLLLLCLSILQLDQKLKLFTSVGSPTMKTPTKAKGKMFTITITDALAETEVAEGMLLVGSKPALVLFDFQCMYSFILFEFVDNTRLKVVSIGYSLLITTLAFYCGFVQRMGHC